MGAKNTGEFYVYIDGPLVSLVMQWYFKVVTNLCDLGEVLLGLENVGSVTTFEVGNAICHYVYPASGEAEAVLRMEQAIRDCATVENLLKEVELA